MDICFYNVDKAYIEFLKKSEIESRGFTCVPNVEYQNRAKFVYGAIMSIDCTNYFVSVTSYNRPQQDAILIKNKHKEVIGAMRFNYMIPIPKECLTYFDINEVTNLTEKIRIQQELAFCRKNREKISMQAKKTYKRVVNSASDELLSNSCDFPLLEQKCLEYCREHDLELSHALPFPECSANIGDIHTAEKESPYKLSGGRKR